MNTDPSPYDICIAGLKREYELKLQYCDRAGVIIRKLPVGAIDGAQLHCDPWTEKPELMLYNLTREETVEVMLALGAGKWRKAICPGNSTRIDYTAEVDGITVQIYGAPPPQTCQIVEEEIDVPAHKTIKRTLICH